MSQRPKRSSSRSSNTARFDLIECLAQRFLRADARAQHAERSQGRRLVLARK
jgi:hypothetical protein